MSPDEMPNELLEQRIVDLQRYVDEAGPWADMYAERIKQYELILKERAESGEYVNH
jgi:hypothetical protein